MNKNLEVDSYDNTYLNLTLHNNTTEPIPAEFYQERSQYYLADPSKYYLAVVRFNIPINSIPIFKFVDGQYTLTLSYAGFDAVQNIVYIPANDGTNPATARDVYNVHQFLDAVNIAFAAALTALSGMTALPGGVTEPPYLIWDPVTELFSLVVQKAYYNANYLNTVQIQMNNDLYNYFINFEVFFNGINTTNGKDYRFIIRDEYNNLYNYDQDVANALVPPYDSYKMTQQSTSIFKWFDITSYVFATNSMPVNREYLSSRANEFDTTDITRTILTDYQINFLSLKEFLSNTTYASIGPYRFVDFNSTLPLRKIDMTLYYQTKTLELNRLYIAPNETLTIKLVFYKKSNLRSIEANKLI